MQAKFYGEGIERRTVRRALSSAWGGNLTSAECYAGKRAGAAGTDPSNPATLLAEAGVCPGHLLARGSRGPKPSLAWARQALTETPTHLPVSPPNNVLFPAKGGARELTAPERLPVSLPCPSGLGVACGLPTKGFTGYEVVMELSTSSCFLGLWEEGHGSSGGSAPLSLSQAAPQGTELSQRRTPRSF